MLVSLSECATIYVAAAHSHTVAAEKLSPLTFLQNKYLCKCTLIPVSIYAYDSTKRVISTQPHRLPCKLVSERVCSKFGRSICGWRVANEAQ
jgi:hypothetical protein